MFDPWAQRTAAWVLCLGLGGGVAHATSLLSLKRFWSSDQRSRRPSHIAQFEGPFIARAYESSFAISAYYEKLLPYDAEQNRMLTLGALDDAYAAEVEEITRQCRRTLLGTRPRELLRDREHGLRVARKRLERDLLEFGADSERLRHIFAHYYRTLEDLATRRPILKFRRQYKWTLARHAEISSFFQNRWMQVSGDPLPAKWGLEFRSDQVKQACDRFLRYGKAMDELRTHILEELALRERERQILFGKYRGISGFAQQISDYLAGKGIWHQGRFTVR